LNAFPGLPVAKVLKELNVACKRDGKRRLEVALELYSGVRGDACLRCKVAERLIYVLMRSGGGVFGVGHEEMKARFRDPYWRRALVSVINGLATFGASKPFIPGAPFQIVWNITSRCNLGCKHCYADAGSAGPEMSTAEARAAISKLSDWGVVVLAFSGGEPLVRRDIAELAKHAFDCGIYAAIASNGVLLTREMCRSLSDAGVKYLQISLDGATPAVHDGFRGVSGAFERAVRGVRNAVASGFFVSIATTATSYNLHEIPSVIDLCEDLGVKWFMLYNFIPTGRGRFISENDLTPEQREELLRYLWGRMRGSKVQLLSTAPQFARVALSADESPPVIPTHFSNNPLGGGLRSLSDFIGGCGAARFYLGMNANGDITPCVFLPMKVANIADDLEAVWKDRDRFRFLRDRSLLDPNCGTCKYKYVCGGCRARTYGYCRDCSAPDPGCILNAALNAPPRIAARS